MQFMLFYTISEIWSGRLKEYLITFKIIHTNCQLRKITQGLNGIYLPSRVWFNAVVLRVYVLSLVELLYEVTKFDDCIG